MRASMTTFRMEEYGAKGKGSCISDHAIVLRVCVGAEAVNVGRVSQRRVG